ncbi:MAG TPA: adenylate/guanylate cyclase domain-containing protein [Actinomycetota bacterium]
MPDPSPPSRSGFLPSLREFFDPASEFRPLSLRFRDAERESSFQRDFFRDNLFYIRLAHWAGIALWIVFWLVASAAIGSTELPTVALRIAAGVAVVVISLLCTYARWYPRSWQFVLASAHVLTAVAWSTFRVAASAEDPRVDWGYAGLMGLMAFTFFFSRLQTRFATVAAVLMIAFYDTVVPLFTDDTGIDLLFANFFLIAFTAVDIVAAYGLERATRLLWAERGRADHLLANTLPAAIVGQLKGGAEPGSASLARDHPNVTVLFADLVSFTERAGQIPAADLVAELDRLFTRFDVLARDLGVEKIKTVGDAYLAVAGAPEERPDHARAVAELALAMRESVGDLRWATGEPMRVRIGVASGPVVAGVIGRERFAYDLWGDTVNLASRLETSAAPGSILLAGSTVTLLEGSYRLGEPLVLNLKGKGPTSAWELLGRSSSV